MGKLLMAAGAVSLVMLTGCESVSDFTKQEVMRSESIVQQSQQTVGNSEAGAVELQTAKDKLAQAQAALKREDEKQAQRLAAQAKIEAELAVAKSQSAAARRAADDLLASVETLRQEANRSSTSTQ
jgi:hypothetical protein